MAEETAPIVGNASSFNRRAQLARGRETYGVDDVKSTVWQMFGFPSGWLERLSMYMKGKLPHIHQRKWAFAVRSDKNPRLTLDVGVISGSSGMSGSDDGSSVGVAEVVEVEVEV